jgi:hypothetical protein
LQTGKISGAKNPLFTPPDVTVDVHRYIINAFVAVVERYKKMGLGVGDLEASYFQVEQYSVKGQRVRMRGRACCRVGG